MKQVCTYRVNTTRQDCEPPADKLRDVTSNSTTDDSATAIQLVSRKESTTGCKTHLEMIVALEARELERPLVVLSC